MAGGGAGYRRRIKSTRVTDATANKAFYVLLPLNNWRLVIGNLVSAVDSNRNAHTHTTHTHTHYTAERYLFSLAPALLLSLSLTFLGLPSVKGVLSRGVNDVFSAITTCIRCMYRNREGNEAGKKVCTMLPISLKRTCMDAYTRLTASQR